VDDICCEVIDGGELRSYKGLNTPATYIPLPALENKDRQDLDRIDVVIPTMNCLKLIKKFLPVQGF